MYLIELYYLKWLDLKLLCMKIFQFTSILWVYVLFSDMSFLGIELEFFRLFGVEIFLTYLRKVSG